MLLILLDNTYMPPMQILWPSRLYSIGRGPKGAPLSNHAPVLVTFQFYYFSNLLLLLFSVAGVVAVLPLQLRQHPVAVGRPRILPVHPPKFPRE